MLEEHSDIQYVQATNEVADNSVGTLGVHKNFAFWISLLMILSLPPLAIFCYFRDKDDIEKYGVRGNPYLKKYALYCFLKMSIKQRKKDQEMKELSVDNSNFQELGQTSNPTYFDGTNKTLANLARTNTPGPQISRLSSEEKEDCFDREEYKATPEKSIDLQSSNILEESKDNLNYMRNEYDQEQDSRVKLHLSRVPIGKKKDDQKSTKDLDSPKSIISRKEKQKIESELHKKSLRKSKEKPDASLRDGKEDKKSVSSEEEPVPSEADLGRQSRAESLLTVNTSISKKRSRKRSRKRKRRTKQEIVISDEEDFKEDPEIMEGGETTDDIETGGVMVKDFDLPPEKKKKKKKWIRKKRKPKQADFSDISSVGYEDDSTVKSIRLNRQETDKFKKNSQFYSGSRDKQNKVKNMGVYNEFEQSDAGSNAFTRQGTAAMKIVNEKAHERHYDGKIFCRTIFYSHRLIGLFNYYNERLPRIHRLLILYVSLFLMLFLSGIFFYENAETKNVGGMSYGH